MFLPKSKIGYLFLVMLSCLFLSPITYAVEMDEPILAAGNEALPDIASDADWEIELPVGGGGLYKPFVWGVDATISTGSVEGGISVAYDSSFTHYAVRCTTYGGLERRGIKVYKSTDNGATWQPFKLIVSSYEITYPQVLVCEYLTYKHLYLFYHRAWSDGQVRLYRCDLDGSSGSFFDVADRPAGDTITYYSACSNISGSTLIVVYEVHESGDATPDVRSVRSTNRGASWFDDMLVDADGQHPDVAYGYQGYTYLVYGTTSGGDFEIEFRRSTNWGDSWGSSQRLIADTFDDDYPKVAALHTTPVNSAHVWVTFNHDYANSGDIDVRYVYSTNSGTDWSSYINLANSKTYDEMAADLVTWRFYNYTIIHVSYLKRYFSISPLEEISNIYTAWTGSDDPTNWRELTKINDHLAASSPDARKICQGTIMPCFIVALAGYVYAAKPFLIGNFDDLYFDGYCFTEVEEEGEPGALPSEFSLHNNYPNPFNPETVIGYSIPRACHVRLEIFNVLGQKIRTLVDEEQTAGKNEVMWDGEDESGNQVASGVYFYKLEAKDFTQTKKMVLIR
ncbi:MAG: hypothetical protein AMJ91_06530 [candidate division Zixibacteria bacterium SM23_73_3]|nr:MAG: hypothetical protein AMJ91_06530 [candidate division Zixibacteria bacterium SM23_73_3]